MPRILRESDADRSLLTGATVGVVGFGNQGAAQALCLRDAGIDVRVFSRAGGPSGPRAHARGFALAPAEDLTRCSVVAILVPDEAQAGVLESLVLPRAPKGALLVFAHGFALRHGNLNLRDDLDVALVGPLGPGALLRQRWKAGTGLAGLLAVVADPTGKCRARALAYADALRLTRAGLIPTTLDEEVVSDLFAEQVVLCGAVPELLRAAWETLVEGGVSEDIAYYSCVQELKQILDLVHAEGLAGMRARTSGTAKYGGLTRGSRIIGPAARAEMGRILEEVKGGSFAREWISEREKGAAGLRELQDAESRHPLEEAGRRVRRALGGPGRVVDSPGAES